MKYWAIPIVIAFILVLFLSIYPLAYVSFGPNRAAGAGESMRGSAWFWTWVGLLAASQAALLIRVKPLEARPRSRRRLLPAIIAASFCFTLLITMVLMTVSIGIGGDPMVDFLVEMTSELPWYFPWFFPLALLGFMLGQWALWSLMLHRFSDPLNPDAWRHKWTRWIFAGSVAELLVAVPCHVLTRKRDDCCAPLVTFWGIVTGISLLLLCLGPAVMYLVQDRLRKKGLSG